MPTDKRQTIAGKTHLDEVALTIKALLPGEDSSAFRTLNEEWILHYFTLEKKDEETLGDPDRMVLAKGGHIFMVYSNEVAVGCVALIPMGHGVYEVSKMAVSPAMWGRGIGRKLLAYTIAQAKETGLGLYSWAAVRSFRMRCICMKQWALSMCQKSSFR